ncbi:glycosyl hydrolase family 35 [Ancylostoma caninum]|uniref:Beta-galactosidase n=1 Tax=Ancylostoma caninum TaxID=29170 RepID=A0A368FNG2_ANCCA|nr:glycosyl hydrolase family 35 [Ancylostoma caninum]
MASRSVTFLDQFTISEFIRAIGRIGELKLTEERNSGALRLYRIRALGFNAIQYYIPWNFHEIFEGEYDFSGWRNFSEFSYIAHDLGLYTLLRIGPYSCGEWENGGFPWWLLNKENCQTRTSQKGFLDAVEKWFTVLLEMIRPLMRQNGGPVLMLQIENEYGSSAFCDRVYTYWLRDFVRSRLGNDTVIYTTDGGSAEYLKCGFVPGTFPTVDFGPTSDENIKAAFEDQRKYMPGGHGPLVNSEFYPGWFVLWGEKSARIPSTDSIMKSAKYMYSLGASFNFYMIHGGTNFAFWNGATTAAPVITSYDYFAPISEAGDVTDKYLAIRAWIKSLPDWKNKPYDVPANNKKTAYGNVTMVLVNGFGDQANDMCEDSEDPMSFEKLEQPFGFKLETCGKTLDIKQLKDFGYVILNGTHTGTFMNSYYGKAKRSVDLERCNPGDILAILVENTARLTSGTENDRKGILSEVRLDNQVLKGWTQCKMLFPNEDINKMNWSGEQPPLGKLGLYIGYFYVKEATDTFLNTTGWGKGIAILNGNNLGRYWPTEGPQHTLYVPAAYVRRGNNVLIMLELEGTNTCQQTSCSVSFVDQPVFVWKKITTVGDFFSGGRGRRRSKNRRRN